MWTLRAPFWPNRARQIVQEYFLSFSWTRVICWFRYDFSPNAFEQVGHTWFICLSWTVATWFLRECSWANDLWQSEQGWFFCISWTVLMWTLRDFLCLNADWHSGQVWLLGSSSSMAERSAFGSNALNVDVPLFTKGFFSPTVQLWREKNCSVHLVWAQKCRSVLFHCSSWISLPMEVK